MESEDRITLRLERQNLARIDEYIDQTDEYASRSELCRAAVDEFLETKQTNKCRVNVRLPELARDLILELVRGKYYASVEDAVQHWVDEVVYGERMEAMLERMHRRQVRLGKRIEVAAERKDVASRMTE